MPAADQLALLKRIVPIVLFALFWGWETLRPCFGQPDRVRHAGRNLALALSNTLILAIVFGAVTVAVAEWTTANQSGFLFWLGWPVLARWLLALVLLDGFMYLWHRANHVLPFLWRFHRMHHSDPQMDVTTATRFHLGEHAGTAVLRLGLIPQAGLELEPLIVYDILLLTVTQFHHANISLGRFDRWLRWLIVTPDLHKVHHSNWRPETDSNYATVLSVWDRLAGTLRTRSDLTTWRFGLNEFDDPAWQTWAGMWRTPLADDPRAQQDCVLQQAIARQAEHPLST